ncbi:MAG: N-formylglutamate amidohydrolase [Paracoccaceae bacterium]
MNHQTGPFDDTLIDVRNATAASKVVIVCEHASAHIPATFNNLGLSDDALQSHIAWDPGAMAVATRMMDALDAVLIAAKTSRLVYDCNRPPDAHDAMPARSEVFDVPGNAGLSAEQKTARVVGYYEPFRTTVAQIMERIADPVLVTVHSFTPVYHGAMRDVEIGILHDSDARLADALLSNADTDHIVRRNEPYGPSDGVTHTLKEHGLAGGHLNVMLEIRNDLIANVADQAAMADMLAAWIASALAKTEAAAC